MAASHPRHVTVDHLASTNETLLSEASRQPQQWPHLSSLRARSQQAGIGRSGRRWETPPGTSITGSVVIRTRVVPERLAGLSVVAGLACLQALDGFVTGVPGQRGPSGPAQGVTLGLKWPNDLITDGATELDGWGTARKVGGILLQGLPPQMDAERGESDRGVRAAVVGIGINVTQRPAELPVPWATSLAVETGLPLGAASIEELWESVRAHLGRAVTTWEDAGGTLTPWRAELSQRVLTLGRQVEYVRSSAGTSYPAAGQAVDIADDGALVVDSAGARHTVHAGEVRHVRIPSRGESSAG